MSLVAVGLLEKKQVGSYGRITIIEIVILWRYFFPPRRGRFLFQRLGQQQVADTSSGREFENSETSFVYHEERNPSS